MDKELEKELLELGLEGSAREEALWKEWRKQHPNWKGRDGGPVDQLRAVREEQRRSYLEIKSKYPDKE